MIIQKLFVKKELFLIFEIIYIMSVVMIDFFTDKKGLYEKDSNSTWSGFGE